MKNSLSRIVIAGLLAVTVLGGGALMAQAQTTVDAGIIIQLQRLIADLQAKINLLIAQGQAMPVAVASPFWRDLDFGASGSDVAALQSFLVEQGRGPGALTLRDVFARGTSKGYYGSLTKAAVLEYQLAHDLGPFTGVFSVATRFHINNALAQASRPAVGGAQPGAFGSLSAFIEATPASGLELKEGDSNVVVANYRLQAFATPVTVERVELNFDDRPWLPLERIAIYDGSRLLAERRLLDGSDFVEISAGRDYRLRFDDLRWVIPTTSDRVLSVRVDVRNSIANETDLGLALRAGMIRGVESSGLLVTAPLVDMPTRIFDIVRD